MKQYDIQEMAAKLVKSMNKPSLELHHQMIRDEIREDEADYYSAETIQNYAGYEDEHGRVLIIIGRDNDGAVWYRTPDGGCHWIEQDIVKNLKLVRQVSRAGSWEKVD